MPQGRTGGLRLIVLAALAFAGCGVGESGIEPPLDRVFFPAGLLVDPSSDWLYVVNANSDLRFNAGTVAAVDLKKAAEDRSSPKGELWAACPAGFSWRGDFSGRFCCRDRLDDRILNCDDRGYVAKAATVRLGSFGGAVVAQNFMRGSDLVRRLFVTVRADPSVTFIDATVGQGGVSMRCAGARGQAGGSGNDLCEEGWKIRRSGPTRASMNLLEEPYALALDDALGILYVGHLPEYTRGPDASGGVSAIDVCAPMNPESPRLASVNREIFADSQLQGVTSLTLAGPGDPMAPILATAKDTSEIAELTIRGAGRAACDPQSAIPVGARDLTLVPGPTFSSSVFHSNAQRNGIDIRGVILSGDKQRAFVLHRNNNNRANPSAVAVIDRSLGEDGQPLNRSIGLVEVCPGPTGMVMHDAGRGQRLFVTCFSGGQIYIVDPDLLLVVAVVDAGRGPSTLVFPPADAGLAYVAGFVENAVAVLDLHPGSRTEYKIVQRIGFPHLATE